MYLWKVDNLIEDLKNNKVSQKEQFKYALAFSIFTGIAADPSLSIGLQYGFMDFVSSVTMLVITVFGVIVCYKENKRADDKDFVLRFFTLGLPVAIRFIVVIIPLGIVAGLLEAVFNPNHENDAEYVVTTIYQVLFIAVSGVAFYIYLASKFRRFAP